MHRRSLFNMLNRLAAQEREFLNREFLAPVTANGEVRVRMAGVICRMRIEPANFRGWGVFQPASTELAHFRREPTLIERQRYLGLLPQVSLLLCERRSVSPDETVWLATAAHRGDLRIQIEGLVPLRMVEDAERFDTARARFDGVNFWFETIDSVRDQTTAEFLRKSLRDKLPPKQLKRSGLTPEEHAAYALCWKNRQVKEKMAPGDPAERRLRSALAHAGAEFIDYLERGDGYRVTYQMGGRMIVTSVDKQDLNVQVAGICLSGEDQKFDLSSLVGVLREGGDQTFAIGEDNQGMSESDYFSMYRRS